MIIRQSAGPETTFSEPRVSLIMFLSDFGWMTGRADIRRGALLSVVVPAENDALRRGPVIASTPEADILW
jgi:hypothetical protein